MESKKRVKDYTIVGGSNLDELEEEVRSFFQDKQNNWEPLGGVVLDRDGKFVQTLVEYWEK